MFISSSSAVFVEILSRRCRLSRTKSDPAQTSGKFQAKIAFFLFFQREFWHDFVTPFSTFANIKGSLPTRWTTLDRLRSGIKTDGEDFPGFWPIIHFLNIVKKRFLSGSSSSAVIYTPKEAHSRTFVTRRSVSAQKCWQKNNFSWRGQLVCSEGGGLGEVLIKKNGGRKLNQGERHGKPTHTRTREGAHTQVDGVPIRCP